MTFGECRLVRRRRRIVETGAWNIASVAASSPEALQSPRPLSQTGEAIVHVVPDRPMSYSYNRVG